VCLGQTALRAALRGSRSALALAHKGHGQYHHQKDGKEVKKVLTVMGHTDGLDSGAVQAERERLRQTEELSTHSAHADQAWGGEAIINRHRQI